MVIKLKVKYLRLDKEKRKEVKQKYYETSLGKYVKKQLISSFICGVLCIGIGIYLLISTKDPKFIDYFYNPACTCHAGQAQSPGHGRPAGVELCPPGTAR